ncbi:MAG TPA: oligosaccharide flippase family protein [Bacteroidales bacterium]|nr:oligosaccharide flippase family protein [Bacteroidales bacterium]
MKRKFVTNLALLLFLNLLVKPVYAFGIDVGVQNTVGAAEYGNYFILLNFTLIFQIILDLGIESFSRREIARHTHLLSKYVSYILPLKVLLGAIYFTVCSAIGYFMGWKDNEFRLLLIMLLNQFLAAFILYFRANLGGMHWFSADSIVSVIDRFVVIVICGFLLLDPVTRHVFRIEWLVYAQTAAYLISASLSASLVLSKTDSVKFRFNLRYYKSFLAQSLPFALLFLLMASYLRVDSVLIGKMLVNGKEQAGIYAQGFRIIEILSNYGYLFTVILLPVFSKMIKQNESVQNLTRLSFTLLIVPALIVVFGCISYRNEIIDILYTRHVQDSANAFAILTLSFLGICITYIFGTLLTANGNLRILNTMAALAVVINITLNLVFIKRFGIIGAAIANACTQLFTGAFQIITAKKIFRFKTDRRLMISLVLFIILIAAASILSRYLQITWYYSFFLYVFFALILSFPLGLMKIKDFSALLLSEK